MSLQQGRAVAQLWRAIAQHIAVEGTCMAFFCRVRLLQPPRVDCALGRIDTVVVSTKLCGAVAEAIWIQRLTQDLTSCLSF